MNLYSLSVVYGMSFLKRTYSNWKLSNGIPFKKRIVIYFLDDDIMPHIPLQRDTVGHLSKEGILCKGFLFFRYIEKGKKAPHYPQVMKQDLRDSDPDRPSKGILVYISIRSKNTPTFVVFSHPEQKVMIGDVIDDCTKSLLLHIRPDCGFNIEQNKQVIASFVCKNDELVDVTSFRGRFFNFLLWTISSIVRKIKKLKK